MRCFLGTGSFAAVRIDIDACGTDSVHHLDMSLIAQKCTATACHSLYNACPAGQIHQGQGKVESVSSNHS